MEVAVEGLYRISSGWPPTTPLVADINAMQLSASLVGLSIGFLAAPLVCSLAIPSSSSLRSDISLLYNNDLNREYSPVRTNALPRLTSDFYTVNQQPTHLSALLLSAPLSHSEASTACAALGESLLLSNKTFFANDLAPLLQYQVFLKNFAPTQQFWIASSGTICQIVNARGIVSSALTCLRALPVLCSQSAAFQAAAQPTTSLTVRSQDLSIPGYVDPLMTIRMNLDLRMRALAVLFLAGLIAICSLSSNLI